MNDAGCCQTHARLEDQSDWPRPISVGMTGGRLPGPKAGGRNNGEVKNDGGRRLPADPCPKYPRRTVAHLGSPAAVTHECLRHPSRRAPRITGLCSKPTFGAAAFGGCWCMWRNGRAPSSQYSIRAGLQHQVHSLQSKLAMKPGANQWESCPPNVPLQRGSRGHTMGQLGTRRDDEPEGNQGDRG